mmetsp:Transcript_5002/g.8697  ORF Transcript_5002/g.8697 Transcript_5002/m.8697 type:complete len:94 (-) Transcript_5002:18-299(-)
MKRGILESRLEAFYGRLNGSDLSSSERAVLEHDLMRLESVVMRRRSMFSHSVPPSPSGSIHENVLLSRSKSLASSSVQTFDLSRKSRRGIVCL